MEHKNQRKPGQVFTNKNIIKYILEEVNYSSQFNLKTVKILEPASGNGAFATQIIKQLYQSSLRYNFSFIDSIINNLNFIEINRNSFLKLTKTIDDLIFELTNQKLNLSTQICYNTNCLTHQFFDHFDCIVGNPPYIRHERIPENDKLLYRRKFKTFKYRADLYIPFFEHSLKLLKPNGLLSFICSNRWLNNQYGKNLRQLISTDFNLKKILNIERASPFDQSVTAYPCITTIQKSKRSKTLLFCQDNSKKINLKLLNFNKVKNPENHSWQNIFLDYNLNHKALTTIEQQNFQIGIGVATGADKIFIKNKKELKQIEKSRILPLLKATDLKNNTFNWTENYLINPYENGELCDLEKYPNLKTYLYNNKQTLQQRHTAKKTPNKWYKTIDKIKPDLLTKPKLLLPDLTANTFLFIDQGNYYPHHNIYYITADAISSLKILASILMSDFIKHQISQIGIRMNGGLPRFQSQLLKQLKIPNINNLSSNDKLSLIKAYDKQNIQAINQIIEKYPIQHHITKKANQQLQSNVKSSA